MAASVAVAVREPDEPETSGVYHRALGALVGTARQRSLDEVHSGYGGSTINCWPACGSAPLVPPLVLLSFRTRSRLLGRVCDDGVRVVQIGDESSLAVTPTSRVHGQSA